MNKPLKHKLDIQLFAEGGTKDGAPMTFDEILADKEYQSEFDRRVAKAIETAKKKLVEEHQAEIAKLSAQSKSYEELEKKYAEVIVNGEKERKTHTIELAVAKSGTIDPIALKAHIAEYTDKAEFKDGKVAGLEEHIQKLLSEDLKHLAPKGEPTPPGTGRGHLNPPPQGQSLDDQIKERLFGGKKTT